MNFIDTHSHLYLPEFKTDYNEAINRAISVGVQKMLLPNIDRETLVPMLELCEKYPGHCYPMIGLHPTSVREDYQVQIDMLQQELPGNRYIAIGEAGIDLYWDTAHLKEQQEAFALQTDLSQEYSLPLIIHSRQAFDEIVDILKKKATPQKYKGIFHSFSGSLEQAMTVIEMGFKLGINGMVTYKNPNLHEVIRKISLGHIVLETDSPYLPPVPYRGKRNESSYIPLIAQKIAEIKNIDIEEVALTTTATANQLFNLQ